MNSLNEHENYKKQHTTRVSLIKCKNAYGEYRIFIVTKYNIQAAACLHYTFVDFNSIMRNASNLGPKDDLTPLDKIVFSLISNQQLY